MTDLKALAYELLHEAQHVLQEEAHLSPTAVAIATNENLIFDLEYESEDEREEIYAEMVDVATKKNATVILTVNDVYLDHAEPSVKLEGPGWGELTQEAEEAIMVTVSGYGFETWSLVCPYFRGERIAFQPAQEKKDPGGEFELLGDWTGRTGAA
ncbi:MAG TPA: hypothetical protein VKZ53_01355 [Candidatus Angelobacter sp.]|nr:hypothetical protein [Candidatus Angelobacter sp.]